MLNAQIRELCGVKKGLDKRIDEGMLWWFAHVQRMERDRIAKRVYVGECAGSCSQTPTICSHPAPFSLLA